MELGTSRYGLIRGANAGSYFRAFVIAGMSAVLLIRAFLAATGYPQVGNRSLHIAHMLWGGLLMLAGMTIVLVYIGPGARRLAAVIGGIGFGLFIDEVGKMITRETDYFYRPAAGIIYLVFAILVVLTQWLGNRSLTGAERTVNALYVAMAGVASGVTAERRRAAIGLIEDSGQQIDDALVRVLQMVPVHDESPNKWSQRLAPARAWFRRLRSHRWVVFLVATYLIGQSLFVLLGVLGLIVTGNAGELLSGTPDAWAAVAVLACALVTAVLTVWGALRLRKDRLVAFQRMYAAVLVDILIGQVFEFVLNQFSAVTGLLLDLAVLGVVSAEVRRLRSDR